MKGVSSLVSLVLYTAIMVVGIAIVVNVALPAIDNMQDSSAIQNSIEFMNGMNEVINEVAAGSEGASRTVTVTFQRGSYRFDNSTGELYYRIETQSNIVSSHAVQERGPLRISADADVSVEQAEVNGTDCWMMENQHLKACVRKVPEEFNASDHEDLVGFWQMDEGSGQWANDSSLSGNDGKLGGSTSSESSDPSWVSGIHGNGLEFDGSDDYVKVQDDSSLDFGTGNFTVMVWKKGYEDTARLIDKRESGSGYELVDRNGVISFSVGDGSIDHNDVGTTNINDSDWHHIAVTWDGASDTATAYLDGDFDGESSYGSTGNIDSGETPFIGAVNGGSTGQFNGTIDEVRVYNRSLSQEEIEWLYLKRGDEEYVNTSHMLVQLRNKDLGEELNQSLATYINGNRSLQAGTGFTEAVTGDSLGRGRAVLNVTSHGESYRVGYELLNGADFLTLRTAGSPVDNATHMLDMVLDSRTGDDKYIDNQQRGEGLYTSGNLDFGYAVGEAGGRVAGLVPGGEFDTVGFDASSGKGFYGFNLTTGRDRVFLPFTEGGHGVIEDRENEIQGDLFGSGNFLGFPSPNFAYGLSQDKTVKVAISFDHVVLNGFDRDLHRGTYDITVQNTGTQGEKAVVNLTVG